MAWLVILLAACSEGKGREDPMLPKADDLHSLLIRTEFSDAPAWEAVKAAVQAPVDGFRANLNIVDDRRFDRLTIAQLLALVAKDPESTFLFLVDRVTLESPEHPVLVVDLWEEPGRSFRVISRQMWAVQNNLVIANLSWEDFADAVDPDGVFRGPPR